MANYDDSHCQALANAAFRRNLSETVHETHHRVLVLLI